MLDHINNRYNEDIFSYINSKIFWILGILLFGAGDIITTFFGIYIKNLGEINLIPSIILDKLGIQGLLLLKIITIYIFYILWRILPQKYRIGIPIGITITGTAIITHNLYILLII